MFVQDPTTGCVLNGTVSVIDERFNMYRVEYVYGACTGEAAVLNNVTFRGLATLDNSARPELLIIGATSTGNQAGYANFLMFART
jgi:hypothetical protein